jgi:transaldolase
MKLFIDTANIKQIEELSHAGLIDGVTTNPTLCAKEGMEFVPAIKKICSIVDGPVSAEAVSLERTAIIKEARELAKIDDNVVVKIPVNLEGLAATSVLYKEGIRVNMTLIFSANQAILAAKAGAAFISPFVGRLDDIGHIGMEVVADCVSIYRNYGIKTEVIAASIRHPLHVTQSAMAGADIATVPHSVIMSMIKHPLTDKGIDSFLKDWEKLQCSLSGEK